MTAPDSQNFETYIPVYDSVPDKWEDGRAFLVEHLKKMTNGINAREIGLFIDDEVLTGQQFIPSAQATSAGSSNSQQYRSILRKVINFGNLPAGGTLSVPHGITFDNNFTLMNMYISATDPVNRLAFSLQFWDTVSSSIKINMDATNINVTTTADYSAYTRSYVVVEYIQEL